MMVSRPLWTSRESRKGHRSTVHSVSVTSGGCGMCSCMAKAKLSVEAKAQKATLAPSYWQIDFLAFQRHVNM